MLHNQIKIFSKIEPELKEYWLELEKNSYSFCFQSYEWFENWFNHYRKDSKKFELYIVVILSDNEVCCIFPLEIKNYKSIKTLQWAGNKVTDYNAPILSKDFNLDKEKFKDLWNAVVNRVPNLDLVNLKQQPLLIEKISNPFVSFLKNYKDNKIYSILLPYTWSEYTSTFLKKKFLNDNLRTKKQLKKLGNLKYKVEKNQDEKIKYIDEIIKQKNSKLLNQKSDNIFNELDKNFYKNFEKKNLRNIKTHISTIFLNNEKIAINWGILHNKRYYYLLPSMRSGKIERYSPGKLLISILIRWAIAKKFQIFDFALGDETYKKKWSNQTTYLYSHVQCKSFKGLFHYIPNIITLISKKIIKFKKQ